MSYVWSFEDLMYNVAQLGGGVETVGPAHHRGFPHVPDEFADTFESPVRRNGLTPTSYGLRQLRGPVHALGPRADRR